VFESPRARKKPQVNRMINDQALGRAGAIQQSVQQLGSNGRSKKRHKLALSGGASVCLAT
jgi:hypothetical protein